VTLINGLPRDSFHISCICTSKAILKKFSSRIIHSPVQLLDLDAIHAIAGWRSVIPLSKLLNCLKSNILLLNGIDAYNCSYAALAARLTRVPNIVGVIHMSRVWKPQRQEISARLFRYTVDTSIDKVIAVSSAAKQQAIENCRFSPDKVTVIYNGINIPSKDSCSHKIVNNGNMLQAVTVARLSPSKDLSTLIRAASILASNNYPAKFTIIGDGPERNELEDLCNSLEIAHAVHFLGWQDQISRLLWDFDLYVHTSLTEGFGLAVTEAMACYLPVIATEVGSLPEIVDHERTGLLIPPGDPLALAGAIRYLGQDSGLRKRMGLAGRQRVEQLFSAGRMIRKTQEFFYALLGSK